MDSYLLFCNRNRAQKRDQCVIAIAPKNVINVMRRRLPSVFFFFFLGGGWVGEGGNIPFGPQ